MSRTAAFGCAFLAMLLGCGLAARIRQNTERLSAEMSDAASNGMCPDGIPQFKQFQISRKVNSECGMPAWGTFYVGILGAYDMVAKDWFSENDPYARFRISDKHWREMRGFFAKNKPVQVTEDLLTETKNSEANPLWKKTFAFHFLCPQLPFAPDDAPMGPKPPIVVYHPRQQLLNKGKSGHAFQLELTIKDYDPLNTDDSLGRVKIPVLDIMRGKYNGKNNFELTEASGAQGTVDILLWYCQEGDNDCEDERVEEWARHGASPRVVKRAKFDCQQGCHTLLNPARGRLAKYVEAATSELLRAIGSADAAKRLERQQAEYDAQSDAAAIGAMEAEHRNETKRLQKEWMKLEELEEMADQQGEVQQANRENAWAKAVGLAKQLAALEGLGAAFCSTSPAFSELLRWTARPLFNFVYDPRLNYLNHNFNDKHAKWLLQRLRDLTARMAKLEKCMHYRWFEQGQLLVNQWETTTKCHNFFNLPG